MLKTRTLSRAALWIGGALIFSFGAVSCTPKAQNASNAPAHDPSARQETTPSTVRTQPTVPAAAVPTSTCATGSSCSQ